jgi:hypothetical protein
MTDQEKRLGLQKVGFWQDSDILRNGYIGVLIRICYVKADSVITGRLIGVHRILLQREIAIPKAPVP